MYLFMGLTIIVAVTLLVLLAPIVFVVVSVWLVLGMIATVVRVIRSTM